MAIAHTEDTGVTSLHIRCSLFQVVFQECAWTFLCSLLPHYCHLVIGCICVAHFFFICGEQNRNMGNDFACFSSAQHAGRSVAEFLLPWSLRLLIIAVASDSRLFGVAEWPEACLCYLKDLVLHCYLCHLFRRNIHAGKVHLASLTDKIKVIGDPQLSPDRQSK